MLVRAAGTGESVPGGVDQGLGADRAVTIDEQHGEHGPLFRRAQRQRRVGRGYQQRTQKTELQTSSVHRAVSLRVIGDVNIYCDAAPSIGDTRS